MLKATVSGGAIGSQSDRTGSSSARGGKQARHKAIWSKGGTPRKKEDETMPGVRKPVAGPSVSQEESLAVLHLRREYEEKLDRAQKAIQQRDNEIEGMLQAHERKGAMLAEAEKREELTRLRREHQKELSNHERIHRAYEEEKMNNEARAMHAAAGQREQIKAARAEAKAEAEATAAEKLKQLEEKHEQQSRVLEERLSAAAQARIDALVEQKKREHARAEKLVQEREAAKSDAAAARTHVQKLAKEKEEALKKAAAEAIRERNAAIQMERDKAENQRRTLALAEATRMAAVNQRSSAADDMTELATQAIKVAEEEKRRAEENFQLAERQKREHKAALEEVEFLREKARIEFKTAKRMKKEAKEMNSQMNDAVEAQKAAVDAVTKNASAEKLALMKAAEEAKYAALHQAEQKRRSDKALQKAIAKVSPESSPDHSPLRRKKHAKSIATTHAETVVGGAAVLKIVDQKKAADIALARAEDAIAVALMNRADDGDRFEAFAETLNATNTKAHEEIVLRQMAEERAEELERKILELKEELTAAMEYKKHWQKSEQRIKDEQKGFEKVLYEERAVKFDALEKLRGAMKAREKIAELNKEQTDHAMGIAASKIDPKRIGTDDAPSQPLANVGIVIGTKLSAATAAMAGFGAGGGNMHEPVVLSIALSKDGEGHASRAAAVAVCLDTEKWIIKWVVDPPKGQKAQQMLMGADGPFGEQSVRISTVKEGFLLYHGSVVVQPRPDAIKLTKRYTWAVMSRIAVKLQARLRTKKVLVEKAKAALKVKQGLLSVRISGVIRGFLARREARRRRRDRIAMRLQAFIRGKLARTKRQQMKMAAQGWGGVHVIATRKALICRESWDVESKKVGEAPPDARVLILDTYHLPDSDKGNDVVRALIRLEKAKSIKPLGWLTASKDGSKSLWPVTVAAAAKKAAKKGPL